MSTRLGWVWVIVVGFGRCVSLWGSLSFVSVLVAFVRLFLELRCRILIQAFDLQKKQFSVSGLTWFSLLRSKLHEPLLVRRINSPLSFLNSIPENHTFTNPIPKLTFLLAHAPQPHLDSALTSPPRVTNKTATYDQEQPNRPKNNPVHLIRVHPFLESRVIALASIGSIVGIMLGGVGVRISLFLDQEADKEREADGGDA